MLGMESNVTQFHPSTRIRAYTVKELLELEMPQTPFLWEPFIPQTGLSAVSGYGKSGKSTLVYALLAAMQREVPFLGFPTKKAKTLVVHADEGHPTVISKLRRFHMPVDADVHFIRLRQRADPEATNKIVALVEQGAVKLVVIDTISNYWAVDDENDNAQVAIALDPFMRLAHEHGVSVLLVHHHAKTEFEDARAIRGATAFFNCIDQALMLFKYNKYRIPGQRRLITEGRYEESKPPIIMELTEEDEYLYQGNDDDYEGSTAATRTATIVRETLEQHPKGLTVKQLAEMTPASVRQLWKLFSPCPDWVVFKGSGTRKDPRVYRLAPARTTEDK